MLNLFQHNAPSLVVLKQVQDDERGTAEFDTANSSRTTGRAAGSRHARPGGQPAVRAAGAGRAIAVPDRIAVGCRAVVLARRDRKRATNTLCRCVVHGYLRAVRNRAVDARCAQSLVLHRRADDHAADPAGRLGHHERLGADRGTVQPHHGLRHPAGAGGGE